MKKIIKNTWSQLYVQYILNMTAEDNTPHKQTPDYYTVPRLHFISHRTEMHVDR
jgi:hypothetical protein